MTLYSIKWALIRAVLITPLALWWNASLPQAAAKMAQASLSSVIGTWKGESICVGDHPACKDEKVVYRFEAVTSKPEFVTLLADKVVDGKRIPMGKLEFQYDEAKGTLSCEFTRRQTHGLWQFKMTRDGMDGTLVLLPDQSVARRVKVWRVKDEQVPPAPGRELYGSI